MGVFRRFYRVRPLAALLLCLPGLILCLWYAWMAYARFDRYRRAAGEEVSLSLEDFHIQLFDILRKDLRKMLMPAPPDPPRIERFHFRMSSDALDTLLAGAEKESKRPYADAQLVRGNQLQDVEVRLRGSRHWHLLHEQKSLKVRLPKGDLLDGIRVFNLVNTPTPMVVEEEIILDLARELDLLTPTTRFARVQLNGADLGVYHFEAQPDESVLRLGHRMPGSIYSGNLPPSAGTEELWQDVKRWKKVAWRSDEEREATDELARLLDHLTQSSTRAFEHFARREIDLDKFATLDALDVLFGSEEHDFRGSHKLYFDPYKGRWEPVAWDFRGFKHEPRFDLVENPLLLRLKLVPGYLSRRNRILYDLLAGEGSPSAVQSRGVAILRKLAPELATDPYWDAYKLLPRVSGFHRRMVRPMNPRRLALAFESELTTFKRRHDFLVREIQRNPLWLLAGESGPETTAFHLVVDGHAGVRLASVLAGWPDDCPDPAWQVLGEGRALTPVVHGGHVDLAEPVEIHPRVVLDPEPNANRSRGNVFARMAPVSYPFLVRASCAPAWLEAEGIHLATGSRVRSRPAPPELIQRLPRKSLAADEVPRFEAGEAGPHPWLLATPPAHTVRLGPGDVEVVATRIYGEHERVEVAAGTRLRMAAGASLVFQGPVTFGGTRERPVVILPAGEAAWGGVAVQGPATRGSTLSFVHASGGSRPAGLAVPYPGMLNVHDTRDVAVRDCRFGANRDADDVVHVAYVEGLTVEDTVVENAASDAFDIEFARGSLRRVRVHRAGDDGLDLMGARLTLADSVLLGCEGNAVSAGEESDLVVRDSLVAGNVVGVLAKNTSRVKLADSLLFRNRIGVRVYQREVRFAGTSRVQADVLYLVGSDQDVKRDDQSRQALDLGRIQRRLPREGALAHLAEDVLGLASFEELDEWVQSRLGEEVP